MKARGFVLRDGLGRPSQVSLVFDRKVSRRTPGRFRTRVITDGVVPSLHVDYKKTRIKQYHKEGQGGHSPMALTVMRVRSLMAIRTPAKLTAPISG